MIKNKSVIAIIPARSGSKGLPGKNIKILCGKPLITWSIEAGLASDYIDEVMVSTDSIDIASIARKFGAKVPFIRPYELATDSSSSYDVIEHTINFYKNEIKKEYDIVVLLEPTSPLREKKDIDESIETLINNNKATAIVGICKTEAQHPAFLVKKNDNNFITGYENKEMTAIRRQDISNLFFFEGSMYVSYTDTLLSKKTFYHENTLGYEVTKWKSIEIDDIEDFKIVEALIRNKAHKL